MTDYGARIFNDDGGILIDSELPSMVAIEAGSLSSWRGQTEDGEWVFDLQRTTKDRRDVRADDGSQYDPNPNPLIVAEGSFRCLLVDQQALLFVRLPVGEHFWLGLHSTSKTVMYAGVFSSALSLDYAIVKPRSLFPLPTGYGMALYNSEGFCTWDSSYALGYIGDSTPWLGFEETYTHRAGCDWVCMPYLPGRAYRPGYTQGGNSVSITPRIERLTSTKVKIVSIHDELHANNGWETTAPVGAPLLFGKF